MALNLTARKEEQEKRIGSNLSKTILPGTGEFIIHSIECKSNDYNGNGGMDIVLNVEGEDLTAQGFEGFFIDKEDIDLGRHKGAVGRVKTRQYSYADKTFAATGQKAELTLYRDNMIMDDIAIIAKAVGKYDALFVGEIADIPSLCAMATNMFKGLKLNLCIGGREYMKGNYVQYELILAKADKNFYSIEAIGVSPSKLQAFDPAKHIIKAKEKATDAMDMGSFEPVEVEMDFNV